MIKPKVVLLIFVSGKIVLTGAKVNFPFKFCVESVLNAYNDRFEKRFILHSIQFIRCYVNSESRRAINYSPSFTLGFTYFLSSSLTVVQKPYALLCLVEVAEPTLVFFYKKSSDTCCLLHY